MTGFWSFKGMLILQVKRLRMVKLKNKSECRRCTDRMFKGRVYPEKLLC